jgi:hypothetical protein
VDSADAAGGGVLFNESMSDVEPKSATTALMQIKRRNAAMMAPDRGSTLRVTVICFPNGIFLFSSEREGKERERERERERATEREK